MKIRHRLLRSILGLYPLQVGKGWVAYLYKDRNIPDGELVRTREDVVLRTRPDYVYKHPFLFREHEPVNTAMFKKLIRPGDVCFDVGANIGFYTCAFAKWGAKVYAFEPLPTTYDLNSETVRLNNCASSVKTYNCGLGEKAGVLRVYTFRSLSHGHASSSDLGRADAVPHDCPIRTVDEFCDAEGVRNISFMKTDVEGFELEVFRGAQRMLSREDGPVVHFEVNETCMRHRKMDPGQVMALLKSWGYVDFIQIGRYGGWRPAPAQLPLANHDYVAFKPSNRGRLEG